MRTDMPEWTDWPGPGPVVQRLLRREADRWWWAPLAAGVIWFVIAWLVLRANVTSLATVGALVGVAFLLAALNEAAVGGFLVGGWKVAHYALAALFVLSAVWALVRPVDTFFALASVLGLILFLQGAFSISRGIALRGVSPYWSLEVLSGVLITLLGLWVSVSDRVFGLGGRAVLILLWVGFMAVFRGTSNIVLAFSMLWYAKRGDAGQPDRRLVDAPPYIPGQERRAPANGPRAGQPEAPSTSGA